MQVTCLNEKIKHLIDLDNKLSKDAVIVDIGASAGEFIESISHLPFFYKYKIFAFEPSKYNVKRLKEKKWKNVTIIQKAVVGSNKYITVELTDFIGKNGRFHQWPNIYGKYINNIAKSSYKDELIRIEKYEVSCIPFLNIKDFIREPMIDYLKIDAEGAEKEFFNVAKGIKLSEFVKQISIEWHYGEVEQIQMVSLLRKMGFKFVTIWKNEIYAQ